MILILILAGLLQLGQGQNIWQEWRPSVEFLEPIYAERIHSHDVFRTSANTWSNLAYVLIGFYSIGIGWRDWKVSRPAGNGYLARTPAMSAAFGVACCYLGIGSGLFHASLTRFGQHLDVAAMYAPLLVLIVISLGRRLPKRTQVGTGRTIATWVILIAVAIVACGILFIYKWSMSMSFVLGTLILTTYLLALHDCLTSRYELDIRWVIASAAALAVGIGCRQIEIAGRWFTNPDAWLQGHSLWHLFTALSLGCVYLFYRSEIARGHAPAVRGRIIPEA